MADKTIDEDKFVIPENYKEDFDIFNRDYGEAAEAASSGYQKLKFSELMTENFAEIKDKYPDLSAGIDKIKEISNENYMGALVEDMSGAGMTFLVSSQVFIDNIDAIITELGAHPEDGSISIPTSGLVKWLEKNGSTIEGITKKELLAGFSIFMKNATTSKIGQILGNSVMAGLVGADSVDFAKKVGKDLIKLFSENMTESGLRSDFLNNFLGKDSGLSEGAIKQISKFTGTFVSTFAISLVMDAVKDGITAEKTVEDVLTAAVAASGQVVAGVIGTAFSIGTLGTAFIATAIGYFGSQAIKSLTKPMLYVDGDIGVLSFGEFNEKKYGQANFDNVETINIGGHEMLSEDCISYLVSKGYSEEDAKIIAYYYGGKDDPTLLYGQDGQKMDSARVNKVLDALDFIEQELLTSESDLEVLETLHLRNTGSTRTAAEDGLPVDEARRLLGLDVDIPLRDIKTGRTVYTYDDATSTGREYGLTYSTRDSSGSTGYQEAIKMIYSDSPEAYTTVEVGGRQQQVYKPDVEAAYLWDVRYSSMNQEKFDSIWKADLQDALREEGYTDSQLDEIYGTMSSYYSVNK